MINVHLSSSFSYRKLSIVSPLSLIISFNNSTKDHSLHWGAKKKRYSLRSLNDQMPDTGRQIWKIWVPKDVELTPLEDKNEQEQTKNAEKGTKRKIENQRKRNEKREMNEKTMKNDLSWNDPWLRSPWNIIWAYLSFLSKPWTLAYIIYMKSPFWLNSDTWTEEVFLWNIFVINEAVVSFPQPNFLISHSPVRNEFLSA